MGFAGGKRVLITGATNGIGLAAARELAGRGAKLAIVAVVRRFSRSPEKGAETLVWLADSDEVPGSGG